MILKFLTMQVQQSAWDFDVPEYPEGFDWFKISFPNGTTYTRIYCF